jgi:DinB superfamily
MDQAQRQTLIERYKQGYRVLAEVVSQLGDATLDMHPVGGGWSPREIIHHLADAELMGAVRLRRLLSEERPPIQGYDQEEFSQKLHYDRPIASSLDVFRTTREANGELLDRLSEDEWAREGTHSEMGRYTLDDWLNIYTGHLHTHVEQIRQTVGEAGRSE